MPYSDKEQQREFNRLWRTARRNEYFEGKSCVECGSTEDLELDHIDPAEKKYNPAALWGMSRTNPNRIAELAKCQALCNTCHKAKTKAWREANRQHGRTMYNYGCRCEICFTAQQEHNKQRYARLA